MEPPKLADRLRGILGAPPGRRADSKSPGPVGRLENLLGGEWQDSEDGRTFVVERRAAPDGCHGRVSIGDLAERHRRAGIFAPMLSSGAPARPPFLFFDLETTGLSGGAGTLACLVGCGSFDDDGTFVTRQYLLTEFSDEPRMLGAVARDLTRAGALVSFNGKSFDAPVLETRYLFHRLAWPGAQLPHIDVLHPSRRFWHDSSDQHSTCSLVALEEELLGVRRLADVSGFEIPGRYFQFVRSGDPRPLAAVLEHNRHDLLSLAGLSARLLGLIAEGPEQAHDAREALALGRLYARAGLDARANEAFERVLSLSLSTPNRVAIPRVAAMARHARLTSNTSVAPSTGLIKIAALRALADTARRARRHEEAATRWRQLLDVPGCPAHVAREASEALAIHHEHRAGDLAAARAFALKSLDVEARPAWKDAVQHRLARIQRKIERSESPGLLAYLG